MIINLLRGQVCDRLGPKMKNQCKSMVSIYLPYVIDLIVMELPPQKICSTIQLCHNMTFAKSTAMSIAKRLKSKEDCFGLSRCSDFIPFVSLLSLNISSQSLKKLDVNLNSDNKCDNLSDRLPMRLVSNLDNTLK